MCKEYVSTFLVIFSLQTFSNVVILFLQMLYSGLYLFFNAPSFGLKLLRDGTRKIFYKLWVCTVVGLRRIAHKLGNICD